MAFAVKFWGVRGGIATPSPRHVGFGGDLFEGLHIDFRERNQNDEKCQQKGNRIRIGDQPIILRLSDLLFWPNAHRP